MAQGGKYSTIRRKPKVSTIVIIVLLHIIAIYGLARAFAPGAVQNVEREIVSAFTVTVTAPEEDIPPENEQAPDEGAAGDPGKKATPKPDSQPETIIKRDKPTPKASSTGTANTSGAKESGDGTGAAGQGVGTGSGRDGSGQGGVAVSKPIHISGAINSARDYPVPEGGRQARNGTRVVVKVTVGTDGRARNCSIFRRSPDAEADSITCRLVVDRLRFKPAMDANGTPVAAPFYWQQKWFIAQ
ncbi:TonB family protein [Pontixanthobacter sp. CEM42]|uniref:energy transducer TonB n=1 Tax=Pontixanthobacter sp. CEM42 TaxID=2792077 RepID=UPI001ADF7299|nr:TonB family protein [Pontixanthobacter sp. CEM42]